MKRRVETIQRAKNSKQTRNSICLASIERFFVVAKTRKFILMNIYVTRCEIMYWLEFNMFDFNTFRLTLAQVYIEQKLDESQRLFTNIFSSFLDIQFRVKSWPNKFIIIIVLLLLLSLPLTHSIAINKRISISETRSLFMVFD